MLIHLHSEYDCDGRLLRYVAEEYEGPIALCGSGPSAQQNAAAAANASLANQLGTTAAAQEKFSEGQQKLAQPFFQSRMQGGLPYYSNLVDNASGLTAQAYAPARAQMMRSLGSQQGLPNGFREGAINDFNENQGRAFDSQLLGAQQANEAAKQAGALGIVGQGNAAAQTANAAYGNAIGANQGIFNSQNLMSQPMGGLGGLFGGLASGVMSML